MNGVLCIDKPEGMTSFDVIARLRRITHTRKIGHTGTLDPMATGLLPVLFGTATKACDLMPESGKRYRAAFQLGVTSDTEDIWGALSPTGAAFPEKEAVEAALVPFRGEILQLPPMYSALSVGGKRLYELAREGKTVERTPRPVTISRLDLLAYDPVSGRGELDVACSKGTYIRTLCADLGASLGTGAVMAALRRTEACGFTLGDALTLEEAAARMEAGTLEASLLPAEQLFTGYPALKLNEVQTRMFLNGVRLDLGRIPGALTFSADTPWRIYDFQGQFLGLGKGFPAEKELRLLKFFIERNG